MGYQTLNNAAEMLALVGASYDPYRNVREVGYSLTKTGFMWVMGVLRDDSTIPANQPRQRVHTLRFKVLVPERVSLQDLQTVIRQQTQQLANR
jgi:hypothetical protein